MARVYLIRHAIAHLNEIEDGIDDLTRQGVLQAQSLRSSLDNLTGSRSIYSSNLFRAIETARISTGLQPIQVEDLKETDLGDWKNLRKPELSQLPDFVRRYDENFRYPNGESNEESYNRMNKALQEIFQRNRNTTSLVFGHAIAMKNWLYRTRSKDGKRLVENPATIGILPNASITELDIDENLELSLVRYADVRHLKKF